MADSLAFLVSDVARLLRRGFDARARAIGVTNSQWRLMLVLSRNEGANQGALAELIDVEPITLCRMIDRLSEAEMVERRPDPSDRRAWRIYLTDKARPLIEQLRSIGNDLVGNALDGIAEDDRQRLGELLQGIRQRLDEAERKEKRSVNG